MLKHILVLLCISDVFFYSPIKLVKLISADENTVFLYNHIENCKSSEYYDVNYFICRECDPQLNLIPSRNGKKLISVNSVKIMIFIWNKSKNLKQDIYD